ncbi:Asparagine synthetase (glutamine-hydrolyzing) [Methanosarcina horonobensis HB-1 = JCM 15518]|uniref:Asparagine synthetase (Glutamine-hydrolyzing) n=1 Tax=Methanosarcina horonobensis HB-1 = JCM 15518 TaxID=1434110 RepID=A0A0E3SJQ6_9EURY|nr:asparagine synthase-related protein [Methanosarcina horonobensis]AKB80543.1 Asparagine synthetase (glutamine-hydrolyzing) [Methanosarcina horonobensis HB-1 = JCM 15518]
MRSEIRLLNEYYPWKEIKLKGARCYLKGNVFFENKHLNSEKFAELIFPLICKEGQGKEKETGDFLEKLNGEFAFVAETKNIILCAVDKTRSIPLFYIKTKNSITISDSAYYLKDKINQHLNEENAAEFMVAGYVTGNETLFDNIKQVRNGEFLIYQKNEKRLKSCFYFKFLHRNNYELPEIRLIEMLDQTFVNTFSRLIKSTSKQGKKLVVPLSGGLDSRIIVAMLKRLGVNDVICMSYGRKGSRESEISKNVAEALGYEWIFVESTAKKWREYYNSKEADLFRIWAGNLSSLPHMQDFPAVKELKIQGKIPENSVFVPGHTGYGCDIPEYCLDNSTNFDSEAYLAACLKKHYNLWGWPYGQELEKIFKQRISKSTSGLEIKDNETLASALEYFDSNERQAKFIINSVRVYEFFGYEWRIPLWDAELMEFFLRVPIEHRINRNLYKKYARDCLFSGELEILKRIDCTTDFLNLKTLEKRSRYEKLLYYRTFSHSYYDEKVNNPVWGRYFENPLISRLLIKVSRYDNENIEEYPLLKTILEYRNKEKYPLTLNGVSSLEYLAGIKGETYSSRSKTVLKPAVSPAKRPL